MSESQLITGQHTIKMYATTWCGDCRMAKRWFDAHGISNEYINIERDERAAAEVLRIHIHRHCVKDREEYIYDR